jgi:hypothetical protein
MPADALPVPWPTSLPGTVRYRREYRDVLGRAMRGTVTLTGSERRDAGGVVILPVSVTVELVDGVLEVDLPADTYHLSAALRTVDGKSASDTATLEPPVG